MANYIEACASDTGLFWSVMRFNMGLTENIRDFACRELLAYSYMLFIMEILTAILICMYLGEKVIRRFL